MTTLRFPDGSEVLYELTRKPVKNINLRVKEDGSLRISANPRVSLQRVEQFIISEQDFIRRAQQRIAAREEHSGIRADIFRWLGSEYPVRVISSSRECAVLEQEEMRVFTRFPDKTEELLRKWTVDNFVELCRKLNAEVRESLLSSGLNPPPTVVTIKDMKSRWGSCTPARGHISLNIRLAPYPRDTVLSVVWHEYAHYWHHDHSARFYAFLDEHFPEYRRWNSLLK